MRDLVRGGAPIRNFTNVQLKISAHGSKTNKKMIAMSDLRAHTVRYGTNAKIRESTSGTRFALLFEVSFRQRQ
jgi:hypothetical protein